MEKIRGDQHRVNLATFEEQKLHLNKLVENSADKHSPQIEYIDILMGDAAYKHDQWDRTNGKFHVEA